MQEVIKYLNKLRENIEIIARLKREHMHMINAIEKDGITWLQVSDLLGWSSSAAGSYQVQSIPATFLIDPDGKIIAGGEFTLYNGLSQSRIVRLNTNGSVDTSFTVGSTFNGAVNTILIS